MTSKHEPTSPPPAPRHTWWRRSAAAIAGATAVGALIAVALPGDDVDTAPSAPSSTVAEPATPDVAPTTPEAVPDPSLSESPAETTSPDAAPEVVAPPTPEPAPEPNPAPDPASALSAVASLEVAGRAPMTGYDRDLFAYRSVDHDRNGCDVRNDVLRRDLVDVVLRDGTQGCVVESGRLLDPYTGVEIAFVRGSGTSSEVQIDHVVAMGNAWAMGAQQWDEATRHQFGNDPLNLLAVDGPTNQQKGAGDAATWLPPHREFRCTYVARQVSVKVAYGLRVTQAEQEAMQRVLGQCPDEPLIDAALAATP
ncbi:HNH endonuclease family protein [Serinibacter arcticus]|uniref:HNH endonuclease family protein n=1 Tax=Serinibacter arcticus TaxID=1655435 RepID=UPI0018EE7247|nr:HNH endonuclease family protein [Serinibacter arcticus]